MRTQQRLLRSAAFGNSFLLKQLMRHETMKHELKKNFKSMYERNALLLDAQTKQITKQD